MNDLLRNGFWIGDCKVEPLRGLVLRPEGGDVHLPKKPMDVLVCLASRSGSVVESDTILDEVWGVGRSADRSLKRCIHQIRQALLDDPQDPRYIETSHGRGYACLAEVQLSAPIDQALSTAITDKAEGPLSQRKASPHRPNSLVRRHAKELILAGVISILGLVLYSATGPTRDTTSHTNSPGRSSSSSIAVLPFSSQLVGSNNSFLSHGIPDALIGSLSGISNLRVVARTSSFIFENDPAPFAELAERLSVDYLIEGSVRDGATGLIIDARLVNAEGKIVWSDTQVSAKDGLIFTIEKLTQSIVTAIQPTPELQNTRVSGFLESNTQNERSYRLFLRGRHKWQRRDEASVRESIELFREAISEDPEFSRAHANLASAWVHLGIYGQEASEIAFGAAQAHAKEALRLNSSIGEAHAVLGMIEMLSWNWIQAETLFLRAIDVDPHDPLARHWYSTFLDQVGLLDESLTQAQALIEIDPASPAVLNRVAWAYLALGQRGQARKHFLIATELGKAQDFFFGYGNFLSASDEDREEALSQWRVALVKQGFSDDWLDSFISATTEPRLVGRAVRELIDSHPTDDPSSQQRLLFLSVLLPDPDLAIGLIEQMMVGQRGLLGVTLWLEQSQVLRSDSRFNQLTAEMGLIDYWSSRQAPTKCSLVDRMLFCHQ